MTEPYENDPTHVSWGAKHRSKKDNSRSRDNWPKQAYNVAAKMIKGGAGKNWNKLYSKIVSKYSKDIIDKAVKHAITNLVELKVQTENKNGKKHYYQARGEYIFTEFFVHPVTGVLTRNPDFGKHRRYSFGGTDEAAKKTQLKHKHAVIDGEHYHQIEDTWYVLTMEKIPEYDPITFSETFFPTVSDRFISLLNKEQEKIYRKEEEEATGVIPNPEHRYYAPTFQSTPKSCRELYSAAVHCIKYRQLGKKDVHRLFGVPKETEVPNIVRE